MAQRKVVLYIYDSDTKVLQTKHDLIIERTYIHIESKIESEIVYARDFLERKMIAVADRPNKVYHDRNHHTYKIWYDAPNKEQAISEIGNYILDHIAPVIRDSESFLKSLQEKKKAAIKLMEDSKQIDIS